MTIKFNFKCPRCEATQLEEVVGDVVQHTVVESIENEGGEAFRCNYGDVDFSTDLSDGIECFQCKNCGFTLCDENGDFITSEDALFAWLSENGMIARELPRESSPLIILRDVVAQIDARYTMTVTKGTYRLDLDHKAQTEFMSREEMCQHLRRMLDEAGD